MGEKNRLDELWLLLLEMSDGVVPVHKRNSNTEILLAHVDGAYFSLVSKKTQWFDTVPDMCNYNILAPWYWSLFQDPDYAYPRAVAGRIRDPTHDCCPEMSWSLIDEHQKQDAIKLAIEAAKLTLRSDSFETATKTSAWDFLAKVDEFMPEMNK